MNFYWPLDSVFITQKFGNKSKSYAMGYHMGIDLRAKYRTPVYSVQDGIVVLVKNAAPYDGYGCHIVIEHEGKIFSVYGHLDETIVTVGQKVSMGQHIGYSGGNKKDYPKPPKGQYSKAGFSSAYHLHYELDKGAIGASHCINPTQITFLRSIMSTDPNFIDEWAKVPVAKMRKKGFKLPNPNTAPTKNELAKYFDDMGLLDKLPDKK